MLGYLPLIAAFSIAIGFNFTKESCNEDINKITQELLSPSFLLEGITVYPEDLEYILFTNYYPVDEIIIDDNTRHLINTKLETKIIISGWLEGYNRKWVFDMRDAYLKRDRYNIIVLKWDDYAVMHYIFSIQLCQQVGTGLGDFIVDLVKGIGLDLRKTHVIGHSLGAHIAGFAGQQIIKRLHRRIGRISALDAAGPLFNFNSESYRLDRSDATFVDGIHTNNIVFGYKTPYATVDVFINNSVFQPGCPTIWEIMGKTLDCYTIHNFLFCSHVKSIQLWLMTIPKDTNMVARHIFTGDRIIVGEDISRRMTGDYFLNTNFS